MHFIIGSLTLFKIGLFGAGHGASENLSYISQNDETWHSYTLPKYDPKDEHVTHAIFILRNRCYDVKLSVHDATNICLLSGSNYIVDVVIWPQFGSSSISVRKVHNFNFVRVWQEKAVFRFFGVGGLGSNSITWDWQ